MSEPKCPDCGVQGVENILSTPSKEQSRERKPWFYVAHCGECGHIYGIFTKHIFGKGGLQLVVDGKQ